MLAIKRWRVEISSKIDASPERVWELLTDTTMWPLWGPSVAHVECRTRLIEPGSSGHVKTAVGIKLPFAITSYEHLQFWDWKVGGVQATGHRLLRKNSESCILIFDMPWWALPYALICQIALNRITRLASPKS